MGDGLEGGLVVLKKNTTRKKNWIGFFMFMEQRFKKNL